MAYSGGFANVPFIIMGELFPARYRALLGPLASSFNLLCAFIVVRTFPDMQITMGKHGAFWFFMSSTLMSIFFVYFYLPETKGHTLEEIEELFCRQTDDAYRVNSSNILIMQSPKEISGAKLSLDDSSGI